MNPPARILPARQGGVFLWALVCIFSPMTYAAPGEAGGKPIPQALGTMKLERLQSGAEARTSINKLHGKQLHFREGYIARYQDGRKKAVLWIAIFDSARTAKEELARMAAGIKYGEGKVFQHFRELALEGSTVYCVTGMGQVHYFFKNDKRLFWLAVPSEARTAILALLRKIS